MVQLTQNTSDPFKGIDSQSFFFLHSRKNKGTTEIVKRPRPMFFFFHPKKKRRGLDYVLTGELKLEKGHGEYRACPLPPLDSYTLPWWQIYAQWLPERDAPSKQPELSVTSGTERGVYSGCEKFSGAATSGRRAPANQPRKVLIERIDPTVLCKANLRARRTINSFSP